MGTNKGHEGNDKATRPTKARELFALTGQTNTEEEKNTLEGEALPYSNRMQVQDQETADCGQINSRNIPNSDYLAGFELRKSSKWSLYGTFKIKEDQHQYRHGCLVSNLLPFK